MLEEIIAWTLFFMHQGIGGGGGGVDNWGGGGGGQNLEYWGGQALEYRGAKV